MSGGMNILENSFRKDYEERKYRDWVTTLPETGGHGSHKRRSTSAPATERGHYPHLQFILSKCNKGLKSTVTNSSKGEKAQTVLSASLRRCPHESSKLSIQGAGKKDVDDWYPKMRNTSDSGRKRKHTHKYSSDIDSHKISEDICSPESVIGNHATLPNVENEGVATSSKRIKLTTPEAKKQDRRSVFETISHIDVGPVDDSEDISTVVELERNPARVNVDGQAHKQIILSGKGDTAKKRSTTSEFLARYRGPENNLPDSGYNSLVSLGAIPTDSLAEHSSSPPVIPGAVALAPGGKTMTAGERKPTSISGQFRPVNNLLRKESSSFLLPRPRQKKAFNIVQDSLNGASDDFRAVKRQKYNTRGMDRSGSSGSIIDLSGDGVQVGAMRSLSSINPTPRKMDQSAGSRSHPQNQTNSITLGNVDEYTRTEAIIGFGKRQRKVHLAEEKRRNSLRGELDQSSRQDLVTLKPNSLILSSNERYSNGVNSGEKTILIDDPPMNEVIEVSQLTTTSSSKTRNRTPRPDGSSVSRTEEKSRYFFHKDEHSTNIISSPDTEVSSGSPQIAVETSRALRDFSDDRSLGNAVDEVQFLEDDSVDLLGSDLGSPSVEQSRERKARISDQSMRAAAIPQSLSISENGDIPESALSKLMLSRNQIRLSHEQDLSFNIVYIKSGHQQTSILDGMLPWKLQYDHEKKEFDIVAYVDSIRETYPGLVLKPHKIHTVKYFNGSAKVLVSRAIEANIGSAAQVFIEMRVANDGIRLAQSLKRLNHFIRIIPTNSVDLDKAFAVAKRSNIAPKQTSQDMALLEVKEARLATQREKAREANKRSGKFAVEVSSQTANVGRRRSGSAEQQRSTQTNKQTVAGSMLPKPVIEAPISSRGPKSALPMENESSSSSGPNIVKAENFYGSRPETRASAGQWKVERQLRPPKSRSPSPVRWTREHPHWQEELSWERSLLFPKEGKKRATVDPEDIERLDEGEFLNDNLIAFYLRYLEYRIEESQPQLARRIYFHNTFFYETLTKGKIRSNNINYEAVKRWTSKVDLFSYDYIVVPVCEKLHWYVAIICNAPRLLHTDSPEIQENDQQAILNLQNLPFTSLEDGEVDSQAFKVADRTTETAEHRSASPSVITQVEHMSLEDQDWPEPDAMPDRLQPGITQLQDLRAIEDQSEGSVAKDASEDQIQAKDMYLKVRKAKKKSMPPIRKYDPDDPRIITMDSLGGTHSPTCSNLREYLVCEAKSRHSVDINPGRLGMTAKGLPQQSNFCDCGVFVLAYIQKFLEDPDQFVHRILQGEMDGRNGWAEMKAPKMRENIRNLIFQLQAREERGLRGAKPGAKQVSKISYTKAQTSQASELSNNGQHFTRNTPSKPTESNAKDIARPPTPNAQEISSKQAEDRGDTPMREVEQHSIERIRARRSTPFAESPGVRVNTDEDSEIMETPDPILATRGNLPERNHHSSPIQARKSPIQLDSPLDASSPRQKWPKSPNSNKAEGSMAGNPFKEFSRDSTSPFQNTRRKNRYNGKIEHLPLEIKGSQEDRRLEVCDSPAREIQREDSFEDILELSSEVRLSKIFELGNSETISSPSVLRRKLGD